MPKRLDIPPAWLAPDEPPVATNLVVLHEDELLVAIDKPAPLPVHSGGRYRHNTLLALLGRFWPGLELRLVHRIDANTTGLVLLAKTQAAARAIHRQLSERRVEKRYLARVVGAPPGEAFCCFARVAEQKEWWLPRIVASHGKVARSSFRVIRREGEHTLLEAEPLTGRTHQLRLHLGHLGLPIVGERAYHPSRDPRVRLAPLPRNQPIQLHSWQLAFDHPQGGERISLRTEMPTWALCAR